MFRKAFNVQPIKADLIEQKFIKLGNYQFEINTHD